MTNTSRAYTPKYLAVKTGTAPARFSFNSPGKSLSLNRQELDIINGINKQRFNSQYAKGVDSFTLVINQKGLYPVLDKSFI